MYIKRNLENTINKYLKSREILAIVGPRQSGKTTLLKKIQSTTAESILLDFEDRDNLELFEEDIKGFAKKYFHYKYIFIDEFQHSPRGGKLLKYLYDTYPENKIIISGSSSIDLSVKAIKHLVGRIFIFPLYHMDFEEFLSYKDVDLFNIYKNIKKDINLKSMCINLPEISEPIKRQLNKIMSEFIIWGGYPRVILSEDEEEKRLVLKNIYNTYFLRDIKDTLGLIDDFKLSRLIKALALQTGQLVEYNSLCQLTGYDYITLKKYINILEKTFVCQSISPFFQNKTKEIVKNPKIYFLDTGLRNNVISNFNNLENRTDKGFLYENFIFTQLLKKEINVNFWRTKSRAEVDFVLNIENQILPVESKTTLKDMRISKSMSSFIECYSPSSGLILNALITGKTIKNNTSFHYLPHWII